MENASKALLIAGAVLIVIVLISIGVLLINRTRGTINSAGDVSDQMAQSTQEGVNTISNLSTQLFQHNGFASEDE